MVWRVIPTPQEYAHAPYCHIFPADVPQVEQLVLDRLILTVARSQHAARAAADVNAAHAAKRWRREPYCYAAVLHGDGEIALMRPRQHNRVNSVAHSESAVGVT